MQIRLGMILEAKGTGGDWHIIAVRQLRPRDVGRVARRDGEQQLSEEGKQLTATYFFEGAHPPSLSDSSSVDNCLRRLIGLDIIASQRCQG